MRALKKGTDDEVRTSRKMREFSSAHPLLSKLKRPAKIAGKALGLLAFTGTVAICGANLGTYFDYTYNTYNYRSMGNMTTISFRGGSREDSLMNRAIETARVPIIGSSPPDEAQLFLRLDRSGETTTLTARYVMVWPTNKGVEHRDEEEAIIRWNYDEPANRFVPVSAQTRYHYRNVHFSLSPDWEPVIVIQNPAHTPGFPGAVPRYEGRGPGLVDNFTLFSAENWAGSSLSLGAPNKFRAMDVSLQTQLGD